MVKPFDKAVDIVKSIGIPFILVNAIGFMLLVWFYRRAEKEKQISADKNRIQCELDVAETIQGAMLPVVMPEFPGRKEFAIWASMKPAKEVGGDFYDLFFVDDDRMVIVIADVSGKGIPAAMFMVIAKTVIQSNVKAGKPLDEAVGSINSKLCEDNKAEMFVTAWIGIMDISTGKVTFVNAGHNPPIVGQSSRFRYLEQKPGFILAGMEGIKYKKEEFLLDDGDELFLYTDGVTEAQDAEGNLYGEDRLMEFMTGHEDLGPDALIRGIGEDINDFTEGYEQFDDITMMSIKMNGSYDEREFPAEIDSIEKATDFVMQKLQEHDIPAQLCADFDLVIDEIAGNIIKYSESSVFHTGVSFNGGRISLRFRDDGIPYDPGDADIPDTKASAQERKIGGLGIFLVNNVMDSVEYVFRNGQNMTTVRKEKR